MSNIFKTQIEHYTEKFDELLQNLESKNLMQVTGGIQIPNLEQNLKENSEEFRQAALKVASSMMPGRVSCTTYAAVCARFCEEFNVPFKAYAGFCLKKSHATREKDMNYFNEKKASGVEHPMMATHVYLEANGTVYEYYSGDTSDIDHIDCVVIAER